MVKYHGSIDYIVLKKDNKYILFFLDNHNQERYFPIPAENIDALFDKLNNDKKPLFLFEELISDTKYISIFPKSKHLIKYLEFYNKNIHNDNIIPVDLRILFDNTDHNSTNIFKNLDYLFNFSSNNDNNKVIKIKQHIYNVCKISEQFNIHFLKLKEHYIKIKKSVNEKNLIDKLKFNNSSSNERIYINFPWHIEDDFLEISESNILNIWELFFTALLELYTTSWIELDKDKYIIVYLGASHCLTIFNLLENFYNYRNIKGFQNLDLKKFKSLHFNVFDKLNQSCIDYNKDIIVDHNK